MLVLKSKAQARTIQRLSFLKKLKSYLFRGSLNETEFSIFPLFLEEGVHLAKDLDPENRMKIIKLEQNCTVLPLTIIINEVM